MKKVVILTIFLLSFFCMFNMGFVEHVRGTQETFRLVNWDSAGAGASNFSTEYVTVHRNAGTNPMGGYVRSGYSTNSSPNSYWQTIKDTSNPYTSFINWSIANTVSGICIYYYLYANNAMLGTGQLYNNLSFCNSTGTVAFQIVWTMWMGASEVYYYDGTTHTSLGIIGGGSWYGKAIFWMNRSTSGSINLKIENFTTRVDGYTGIVGTAIDFRFIKSIRSTGQKKGSITGVYENSQYIDDIYLSYDTSYEEPPSYGGDYLDQWDYIGSWDYQGHQMLIDDRVLEIEYGINMNTTIKGVDLMVRPYQYETIGHVLTFYYLKVNGIEQSHPDYFFNLNGNFVMRWQFNQSIENKKVLFEFLNMWKPIGSTYYWDVLTGGDLNSIDWDNDAEFKHDNNITYYDGYYNSRTVEEQDFVYKFYYEGVHIKNTSCDYDDFVVPDFINPEGALYRAGVPLPLIYTVSKTYPLTYFSIYNMTTVTKVYNKLIHECSGIETFITTIPGSYCAVIRRLNINVSNSFYFTLIPAGNNWIYCMPEPSYADGEFTMYYDYLAGDFEKGLILGGFSPAREQPLAYENAEYKHFINDSSETGSTTLSYGHRAGIYFFKLYVRIYDGSQYVYSEIESYTHRILPTGGYLSNTLYINPKHFIINDGDTITFRAYGQRILIGTDNIHILANNYNVYTLPKWEEGGNYNSFSANITLSNKFYKDSHIINISLVFVNNVTQLLLDDPQFINIEFKKPGQGTGFSSNENYLLGFVIIAIFLSIPLIIQMKSHIEIHILIYMFFGFVGLMLTLVLEILPWYIPSAIIVLMVFAIIVTWLNKSRG